MAEENGQVFIQFVHAFSGDGKIISFCVSFSFFLSLLLLLLFFFSFPFMIPFMIPFIPFSLPFHDVHGQRGNTVDNGQIFMGGNAGGGNGRW